MNVMAAKIPSLVVLAFLAILPLCQAATISADAVALMAAAGVGLDDSPLNQPATPLTLPELGDIPVTDKFWTSFFTALLMIMVSELGDKTFLIAAIMAMRHSRVVTFVASLGALALMTIISAAFGLLLPNLIPRKWTLWGAAILFAVFGLKMLVEAFSMSAEHMRDEYDEVSHEIEDSEDMTRRREVPRSPSRNLEGGGSCSDNSPLVRLLSCFYALRIGQTLSPVAMQTFSLTFLAEWGDRSQIATIALAAAQNVYGVATGAIMGHAVCTALAVLSGKLMATVMSIRTVTALGGFSFIVFAIFAIL
jgi:putative Ca2+/H+ antiporter (TMEM165/GDT1 family)